MSDLLALPNGNLHAPDLIRGVVKFPGKGVALRNEFNKMLDFEKEADPARQQVIVDVLSRVLQQGRNWKQPHWANEFAKAAKEPVREIEEPIGEVEEPVKKMKDLGTKKAA